MHEVKIFPLDKQTIEERLDKLEKENREVREENKKLRKLIKQNTTSENTRSKSENVSRRQFLKKLGAGAIGLGAASLIPNVAGFDIKSSDGLEVWGDGTKHLNVPPGGPVQIENADLDMRSNQIIGLADPTSDYHAVNRKWAENNLGGVSDHSNLSGIGADDHHPQDHGNEDHTETFAVDGDAQPPENHGNGAHNEDYLTSGDVSSLTQLGEIYIGSVSGSFDDIVAAEYNLWSNNVVCADGNGNIQDVPFSDLTWSPEAGDILVPYIDEDEEGYLIGYRP